MKIIFEREKCIGCGSCVAICPEFWEIAEDGKSHLKNSKRDLKTGNDELEITKVKCGQDATDVCPVQCIHIIQ